MYTSFDRKNSPKVLSRGKKFSSVQSLKHEIHERTFHRGKKFSPFAFRFLGNFWRFSTLTLMQPTAHTFEGAKFKFGLTENKTKYFSVKFAPSSWNWRRKLFLIVFTLKDARVTLTHQRFPTLSHIHGQHGGKRKKSLPVKNPAMACHVNGFYDMNAKKLLIMMTVMEIDNTDVEEAREAFDWNVQTFTNLHFQ